MGSQERQYLDQVFADERWYFDQVFAEERLEHIDDITDY